MHSVSFPLDYEHLPFSLQRRDGVCQRRTGPLDAVLYDDPDVTAEHNSQPVCREETAALSFARDNVVAMAIVPSSKSFMAAVDCMSQFSSTVVLRLGEQEAISSDVLPHQPYQITVLQGSCQLFPLQPMALTFANVIVRCAARVVAVKGRHGPLVPGCGRCEEDDGIVEREGDDENDVLCDKHTKGHWQDFSCPGFGPASEGRVLGLVYLHPDVPISEASNIVFDQQEEPDATAEAEDAHYDGHEESKGELERFVEVHLPSALLLDVLRRLVHRPQQLAYEGNRRRVIDVDDRPAPLRFVVTSTHVIVDGPNWVPCDKHPTCGERCCTSSSNDDGDSTKPGVVGTSVLNSVPVFTQRCEFRLRRLFNPFWKLVSPALRATFGGIRYYQLASVSEIIKLMEWVSVSSADGGCVDIRIDVDDAGAPCLFCRVCECVPGQPLAPVTARLRLQDWGNGVTAEHRLPRLQRPPTVSLPPAVAFDPLVLTRTMQGFLTPWRTETTASVSYPARSPVRVFVGFCEQENSITVMLRESVREFLVATTFLEGFASPLDI